MAEPRIGVYIWKEWGRIEAYLRGIWKANVIWQGVVVGWALYVLLRIIRQCGSECLEPVK